MMPRYPIYIPSKGRHETQKTSHVLAGYGVPHYVVVEQEQLPRYLAHKVEGATYLVLPEHYLNTYETCDDLGRSKSVGPGAARNFVWDHASAAGSSRHWVMDDNIRAFWRFHRNRQIRMGDGTCLAVMEDFADRYSNVAMAGPTYYMFVARKDKYPPYVLNTRIYSCNLILNEAPFRWRGRYNEDTDLSLRMLKAGWCTVQFNAFLQHKIPTQMLAGGNTEAFYAAEGTKPKSEMLARLHPDVARVVWKFGRWHHEVNYAPFRVNTLAPLPGLVIPDAADDYGLRLYRHNPDGSWSQVPEDAKNEGPDFEEVDEVELNPSTLVTSSTTPAPTPSLVRPVEPVVSLPSLPLTSAPERQDGFGW